ncbi:MAG: amidohydrolase family protein, partial [Dehalococcoidia bacterium]
KSNGTFFVPTMATAWAYRRMYPELFSALIKLVHRLKAAGINIAAGTDAGAPGVVIGRSLHKELELLVEAGMSPVDAIMCATGTSAENLGRAGDLGIIKKGF